MEKKPLGADAAAVENAGQAARHAAPHVAQWKYAGRIKETTIGGFYRVESGSGLSVAYVGNRRDAKMIAATPDLLDALKLVSPF